MDTANSPLSIWLESDLLWLHHFARRHNLAKKPLRLHQSRWRLGLWIAVLLALAGFLGLGSVTLLREDNPAAGWIMAPCAGPALFFATGFLFRLRRPHWVEISRAGWKENGQMLHWHELKQIRLSRHQQDLALDFLDGHTPDLACMPVSRRQVAILICYFQELHRSGKAPDFSQWLDANDLALPYWRLCLRTPLRWLGTAISLIFSLLCLFIAFNNRNDPNNNWTSLPNSHWIMPMVLWSFIAATVGLIAIWSCMGLEKLRVRFRPESLGLRRSLNLITPLCGGTAMAGLLAFGISAFGMIALMILRLFGVYEG